MSGVNWDKLGPRVTITREDGESRVLALEQIEGGGYFDIGQSPDEGFPPPLAIGPPEQRTDVRTRQTIYRDGRRGMGTDELDETQGTSSFRYSQWDTRFPNVRVMRPLPVRLGGSGAGTVSNAAQQRIAYVGDTARWFCYSGGTARYFRESDDTWQSTSLTNGSLMFHQGAGGLWYIWDSQQRLSQSDDGATWNTVDVSDINTALTPNPPLLYGVVTHDNKLFTLAREDTGDYRLFQSTDAVQAPTTANWTMLGTLLLGRDEVPTQLYLWKFPRDPDRYGIYCLTNRSIYWYDDTADAASPTAWKLWHPFDVPVSSNVNPFALVWGRTGDKYVMPSIVQPNLWQFTGSTIVPHGPNKRGGLPPAQQHAIYWAAANSHAIVAWCQGSSAVGSGNRGLVVAFNEQEGWHHLLDPLNTGIIGSNKYIVGGGLGPTSILSVLNDGTVWEQEFFDSAELPQYATTPRSYDSTALDHDHAKTDIGSPNLPKVGLYVETNAKIPAGGNVFYYFRADDFDQTGAWTGLGFADHLTPMPYRVGFPNNTHFKQVEIRERGTRGTNPEDTVIVYSTIVHATLLPPARFNTQFRVDLRSASYRNAVKAENGYGLSELRTWVRGCHGRIVSFTIHHPGEALTVARGQAAVTPIESAIDGLGRYSIQIRNLETPQSG